jgi:hypothetical protein
MATNSGGKEYKTRETKREKDDNGSPLLHPKLVSRHFPQSYTIKIAPTQIQHHATPPAGLVLHGFWSAGQRLAYAKSSRSRLCLHPTAFYHHHPGRQPRSPPDPHNIFAPSPGSPPSSASHFDYDTPTPVLRTVPARGTQGLFSRNARVRDIAGAADNCWELQHPGV